MATSIAYDLPLANSTDLVLRHPSPEECVKIWNTLSAAWMDSLTPSLYLEESLFLTSIPLAKDGGLTIWILVHKDHAPGQRQILCSCESFLKHSLASNTSGTVSDNIVHGIASVFCPTPYRRRGYAARMMSDLAKILFTWQTENLPCVGTTLYSDIGKSYYTKLGWLSNATNSQVELQPDAIPWPQYAKKVTEYDLENLCKRDELITRSHMAVPTEEFKTRFTIIADVAHIGWHLGKESFSSNYLFGKVPTAKGAIAGPEGNQMWALWTHRYYGRHDVEPKRNVLYILRLVSEVDETATRLSSHVMKRPTPEVYQQQIESLKAILQAAQAEASAWNLNVIKLWDPTPLVSDLLAQSSLTYDVVEREEDSIASLLWYDTVGGIGDEVPLWVNNEHYAWQ
jgi:hypothetical protein